MNITEPIRNRAHAAPGAPAIVRSNGSAVSYAELERIIDGIARRALAAGLVAGDVVGLDTEGTPRIGGAFATLVISLALARVGMAAKVMAGSTGPVAARFTASATHDDAGARSLAITADWFRPAETDATPPVPIHQDGEATCRIFPTWDASGTRHEVAISHVLTDRRLRSLDGDPAPSGTPVTAVQLGMTGPYGYSHALRAFHAGGTLAIVRRPEDVMSAIERMRASRIVLAPGMLEAILDRRPGGSMPFEWIESLEVGGGEFPVRLHGRACATLTPNVRVAYGFAEAGLVASAPLSALVGHPGAVGRVIRGIEVQAVDAGGLPLPPGNDGILRIRSDCCVDRYVDDAAATARTFRDGWFYPGDRGSLSGDGMLFVTGRAFGAVARTAPATDTRALEDALRTVPGVSDAVAFGVPGASGVTSICAAIVADAGVDENALRAACRDGGTIAPERVIRLRSMPRDADGNPKLAELVGYARASGGTKLAS